MTPYEQASADGRFLISTDPARLDLARVQAYLSQESYWAAGISLEKVQRAAEHSLCFGLYEATSGEQVGYARVITDYVSLAYLCDVFVLTPWRGQGLGKWLVAVILAYPDLPSPRRWLLATKDAHGLYAQNGFEALPTPERWMVKLAPNPYA